MCAFAFFLRLLFIYVVLSGSVSTLRLSCPAVSALYVATVLSGSVSALYVESVLSGSVSALPGALYVVSVLSGSLSPQHGVTFPSALYVVTVLSGSVSALHDVTLPSALHVAGHANMQLVLPVFSYALCFFCDCSKNRPPRRQCLLMLYRKSPVSSASL